MQFFWKYIDDLMGKGLDVFIITELLFYVSVSIIPLALPLAVLISSIMTLGNLAENNELTALKSAGLSLYRILMPLIFTMVFLAIGTFYFSNYALPVVNLKWRWIIYDIQQQKPTFTLDEGKFFYNIDGYAIKANKINKETSELDDIVIYDHTIPRNMKVIRAAHGKMSNSDDKKFLYLELFDGRMYHSLTPNSSANAKNMPFRKTKFKDATIQFDMSGFSTNRSNQEIFKNNVEMLSLNQLKTAIDSVKALNLEIKANFAKNIKNQHGYFLADSYIHGETVNNVPNNGLSKGPNNQIVKGKEVLDKKIIVKGNAVKEEEDEKTVITEKLINIDKWTKVEMNNVIQTSSVKLRNRKDELKQYIQILQGRQQNLDKYEMERHRKYSLSISIIVLFCIGAPLGAIIRKGGLGMPVVVSVFLFIIYYVLMITGEKMVKSQVLEPWVGMWLSTFVLTPIALLIMYKAANDSKIFGKEFFSKIFGFKRLFKRLNLSKKE
jgi:lipopolysaccharide export system permease protein